MDKTSLGDRMKGYEATTKANLLRRTPVIIRVDGKAFHTWTKQLPSFDRSLEVSPFSEIMHGAMTYAMMYAMSEMQNVQLAYTQSDEMSFFLKDWDTTETQQWFGGGIQKMASVTASLVTAGFIQYLFKNRPEMLEEGRFPSFDARVFQLPKEEVANYFIWRQQDASRNSVQMLGRYYFSHKEMHQKNVSAVQDMLMLEKGINWNDIDTWMKRGSCAVRRTERVATDWRFASAFVNEDDSAVEWTDSHVERSRIVLDDNIPIFTQDRGYIEDLL